MKGGDKMKVKHRDTEIQLSIVEVCYLIYFLTKIFNSF